MSYCSGTEFDLILEAATEAELALGSYLRSCGLLVAAQERERVRSAV